MDDDALISRKIALRTSVVAQEAINGIKTACGASYHSEVFYLAFDKLFDVAAIREAGYRVAAMDERGVVRQVLKEKTADDVVAADKGRATASIDVVALTWLLEPKLFLLKDHYKTENEQKLFRLAIDNLAELVDMRQLGLKTCGVDICDNPVIPVESPYLDRAEVGARAARAMFFKSVGLEPNGPR